MTQCNTLLCDGFLTKCKGAIHIRKSTTVIFWINCQFEAVTLFNTKFQGKNSVLLPHQSHPSVYFIIKVNFKFYLHRDITLQNYPQQNSHPAFCVEGNGDVYDSDMLGTFVPQDNVWKIVYDNQRCQTHGAKLWNRHVKIMVHYGTCLQDACAARNSN